MNNDTGVFKFFEKGTAADVQAPAAAAAAGGNGMAAARRSFVEVSGWVTRATDMVPPDKYSYRPVATVRTFGQIVGHLSDAYLYYCGRASAKTSSGPTRSRKARQTRRRSSPSSNSRSRSATPPTPTARSDRWWTMSATHSLHYGNIITYMRMLGLTPPSS